MKIQIIVDSIVTATTITVQDSTDLVSYEITNAKLINVIPDMDAVSLLIYIQATDDGSITLTIPRSVLMHLLIMEMMNSLY